MSLPTPVPMTSNTSSDTKDDSATAVRTDLKVKDLAFADRRPALISLRGELIATPIPLELESYSGKI